jgi:hypothetical protein
VSAFRLRKTRLGVKTIAATTARSRARDSARIVSAFSCEKRGWA